MNRYSAFVVVVCACVVPTSVLRAQIVGRLLEVNGAVTVRPASGEPRPAGVYGGVAVGDRLVLPEGASLVLAWPVSGELQRVSGGGAAEATVRERSLDPGPRIVVTPITPPEQEVISKGVKELAGLPSGAVTVTRGALDKPVRPRIAPILGSTVLSVEPSFSWPPAKDATKYRLRLSTGDGPLWERQPSEAKTPYPSPKPLERGLSYEWTVTAALPDKPEQEIAKGEFSVAAESEARHANELKSLGEKLAEKADECILSLVALRLDQEEFTAEALAVYEKLAKLSDKTAAYQEALAELYAKAGRAQEASEARTRALKLGGKFN